MNNTLEMLRNISSIHGNPELFNRVIRSELIQLPIIDFVIRKGMRIYRCRPQTFHDGHFHCPCQISYRKSEDVKFPQRCNMPGNPVLYASLSTAKIEQGYFTAVMETSSLIQSEEDGIEFYTLSQWECLEDLYVSLVCPDIQTLVDSGIHESYFKGFESEIYSLTNDPVYGSFYREIGGLFKGKVNPNDPSEYYPTAIVSEMLLDETAGIMYPSVKAGLQGVNVALRTDVFDQYFKLLHVSTGELFIVNKDGYFGHRTITGDSPSIPFGFSDVQVDSTICKEDALWLISKMKNVKSEAQIRFEQYLMTL